MEGGRGGGELRTKRERRSEEKEKERMKARRKEGGKGGREGGRETNRKGGREVDGGREGGGGGWREGLLWEIVEFVSFHQVRREDAETYNLLPRIRMCHLVQLIHDWR
jgi:hypothetical protein